MASEVVMPRLGWTMEVGRVVEWLKGDGEAVEAGEFIFSVESDKAITEVEALDSGVLRIPPDTPIGIEVPVGSTLAYIAVPGEEVVFASALIAPMVAEAPVSVAASAPAASRWREVSDSAEKVRIAGRFPFGKMRATIGTCSSALVATGTVQ